MYNRFFNQNNQNIIWFGKLTIQIYFEVFSSLDRTQYDTTQDTCYHIQLHLNKVECFGKVHLFEQFNSNYENRVLNKFNAQRLKKFKSFVLLIMMIWAHI